MPRQLTQRHYDEIENQLAQVRAGLAPGGAISNPSWLQAAWFVDPANSTGLASDNNSGLTALTPVRTWNGGVIARLGTFTPRIRQNTTITFLSSHVDNTDPVIFNPFIENSAQIVVTATLPPPVATGVLGVVAAKSAATNTILSAGTIPGVAAVGQLLVNTTRGNSRAWVEKLLGAPSVQLSQPFAPSPVPVGSGIPVENNAWTTGDTVSVFNLLRINIEQIAPVMGDTSSFSNVLAIYNLAVFDPGGFGISPLNVNTAMQFIECDVFRAVQFASSLPWDAIPSFGCWAQNTGFRNGINGGSVASSPTGTAFAIVNGGYALAQLLCQGMFFDGDFICGVTLALTSLRDCGLGAVAVDTGATLNVGATCAFRFGFYGANVLYGGGTINGGGTGRLSYRAGAGAAVASFPLTPRIQLNAGTTAHSVIAGSPDVLNGGITITAAALDAAAGAAGFGGNAFNPGGASIVNLPL